jgi:thymidylate kinase
MATETERQVELPVGTLSLLADFLRALHEGGIRYCHWKSTPSLPRALAGRTDLDLLVDRNDADRFALILRELGFKPFISHVSRRYPAVEDYLGFDQESGRLVHLHIYYQLVLGEHYIKNHRLPLERAFLDASTVQQGVRIPPPALELVVLTLRTLLKYTDTDALKDFLRLGHRGGLPPEAVREVRALQAQTDNDRLRETATRNLPGVPADLFVRFGEVVAADPRNPVALLILRSQVRRALRPYRRLGAWSAGFGYLRARLSHSRVLRPFFRRNARSALRRKSPLAGGLTVAVLGPDGAGKTTITNELHDWLAWRLNMRILYMGSARPSLATRLLKFVSSAGRAADRSVAAKVGRPGRGSLLHPLADLAVGLRYLGDARDRAARATAGRRLASQGAVVVFDRYPLDGVRLGERMVDGARMSEMTANTTRGLLGRLRRREEAIYRRILPPDHVIMLMVPTEVALTRKGSKAPENVAAKGRALEESDLVSDGLSVIRIDATRPIQEVVSSVKAELWRRL